MRLYGQKIDGVFLDLDGTLIFSEDVNVHAIEATCKHFAIPHAPGNIREFIGMTNSGIFREILARARVTHLRVEELSAYKREYYISHVHLARPVPDAVAFIRAVKRQGLPIAIATAASNKSLDAALRCLGLAHEEFCVLLPADALPPNCAKPNAYHWAEAMRLCGVAPEHALIVEDSPKGVKSGHEAHGIVCGIATTHHADVLYSVGANYVVESFAELAGLLELELEP